MYLQFRHAFLLSLAVAGLVAAADPPYSGKWKLNAAKSDFGQSTVTYEKTPAGEIKVTAEGQSYTVKTDGKEYPTPWGTSTTWRTVDASTWESTDRVNGKTMSTNTLKVSPDNKTLTVNSKRVKATGETSDDSIVLNRVSGDSGLIGKWRTKNFNVSKPGMLDIAAKGADGLVLTFVDEKGVCDAKFDGKQYPASGPMWPAGWTCTIARSGAHGFDLTWSKDGKPMFKGTFTPSNDGKTLTETASSTAIDEKMKVVYDRQ
jgi:hypothetical protein